jgi:hypothetical protein
MPSKLQTFTRKRNWGKGRIASLLHQVNGVLGGDFVSVDEEEYLQQVRWRLRYLVDHWNSTTGPARRRHGV